MRGMQGLVIVGALLGSVSGVHANGVEDNNNCYEQFRGGDMKLAIYYCSRAIQSGDLERGDMVVALLNRGVAYKNTGNLAMAVVDYSSALELSPGDALLFSNRANAYRELNRPEEAMSDINRSIELNPENPAAFYVRGLLFEAMGDAENARRDFLRAHEISPEDKEFRERAEASGASGQSDSQ